jgi:protein MEMO1, putative
MHLPFIAKVMEDCQFTIVPVLVGSLYADKETLYGKIFAPYLTNPENLFVFSSDFCHWGKHLHAGQLDFKIINLIINII